MLKQQWYAVCAARNVRKRPLSLRRFGRPLVLWRDSDGQVRCAIDACAHRGAALSRGRVVDGCLRCPYHGLSFDSAGRCVHVPAHPNQPIDPQLQLETFPVCVERGLVWVFNGRASDAGPLPWDEAFQEALVASGGAFADLSDTLPVSYLRVMENLTDFHHVAHVHRWTAPVPAQVLSFEARRQGHHIRAEGVLGSPDGSRRFRARTHVIAPFLALLEFDGVARFAVVATPIDDDHVWLFARYTQSAVQIPGLNRLLTWILGAFDYRLLQRWQDMPVWRSQRLKDPADIGRYALLPADEGIRHYFDIHHELTDVG